MDRQAFWDIVDRARGEEMMASEGRLTLVLAPLEAAELVEFQRNFDELFYAAYLWKLWGAAYFIGGGCSDDSFMDFRYGLIACGRKIYEAAVADPDSLADTDVDEDIFDEGIGYAAARVYEEKTGREIPRNPAGGEQDMGEQWDFDDDGEMKKRLPKLWALVEGED